MFLEAKKYSCTVQYILYSAMHAHLPTRTPLAPVAPLIIFEIICVPLNTKSLSITEYPNPDHEHILEILKVRNIQPSTGLNYAQVSYTVSNSCAAATRRAAALLPSMIFPLSVGLNSRVKYATSTSLIVERSSKLTY